MNKNQEEIMNMFKDIINSPKKEERPEVRRKKENIDKLLNMCKNISNI